MLGKEVELTPVRVGRVDDRRARPQAACLGEQLEGAETILGEAFVDLTRLLVCVDVQYEALPGGVCRDLRQPVARACADGMGGKPNTGTEGAQRLHLGQIVGHRVLTEPVESAAAIGGQEEDELDAGLPCRGDRRLRLGEADVVELADRGVAGGSHLAVRLHVALVNRDRGQAFRQSQHGLPPGPEVSALDLPTQGTLEGVAVGVHEA